jgi:dimethylargininase
MLRNEGDRLTRVVVCTPRVEYFDVDDLELHNITQRADKRLAIRQHDALKSRIAGFGSQVIDVPELVGHPNSVFTRDTALSTPNGYVRLRLGLDTRQGEGEWMSQVLDGMGEPCVGEISAPGTVEGGDVVLAGSVAFVGRSIRTNADGVAQLATLLSGMDYEMRIVHLPDYVLHLDKAMMVLGPDRILYCGNLVPRDSLGGFDLIEIPCGGRVTANIICLGDGEVIVERSNHEVIERLDALGLVVHALDLSEFVKGTGGPNCLIMPVERK